MKLNPSEIVDAVTRIPKGCACNWKGFVGWVLTTRHDECPHHGVPPTLVDEVAAELAERGQA